MKVKGTGREKASQTLGSREGQEAGRMAWDFRTAALGAKWQASNCFKIVKENDFQNSIPSQSLSHQFSRSVVSDSLQPHGLQHARLPCPSPTPRACSNSCPLSRWCHPAISSSVIPFSSHLQSFPASESFSNESVLRIRWPKYWSFSFSISPSNEYSGLISFRMDWLDLPAVQGTLKSLLQYHSSKASVLQCSAFYRHDWVTITFSHLYI